MLKFFYLNLLNLKIIVNNHYIKWIFFTKTKIRFVSLLFNKLLSNGETCFGVVREKSELTRINPLFEKNIIKKNFPMVISKLKIVLRKNEFNLGYNRPLFKLS